MDLGSAFADGSLGGDLALGTLQGWVSYSEDLESRLSQDNPNDLVANH
jgi:hypothetical protein